MKTKLTRKLLGSLAMLFGVWWVWVILSQSQNTDRVTDLDSSTSYFMQATVILLAIPGILIVLVGASFFRKMQESSLKCIIGIFALFFVFFLTFELSDLLPVILPEDIQRSLLYIIVSIMAIGAYLVVTRLLLRHFTNQNHTFQSLLNQGILVLMAWQIWLLLSEVFRVYTPTKEGYSSIPQEPWGTLGVIVPLAAAYGFYKILVSQLIKN